MPFLAQLPEARHAAVRDALAASFGSHAIGDLHPLTGGVSGALIAKFQVRDRSYVLRIEPERIARRDRERGFACMTSSASAGVAPKLHYADPESGVAIMDFVQARSLSEHPGGPLGLARALGDLVASLQKTPLFANLGDYPTAIAALLTDLAHSSRFACGALEPHAEGLARICAALPWDTSSLVSSHNDPNPRNLLFDGERLWLIDWELAFRNDPLVDVAILTTEVLEGAESEYAVLSAAFGAPPTRQTLARLKVIRLLTRLFYGCVVLASLRDAAVVPQAEMEPPHTPQGFREAVADGRLVSGTPQTAQAFGWMSLRAFQDEIATSRFDEALQIASQA